MVEPKLYSIRFTPIHSIAQKRPVTTIEPVAQTSFDKNVFSEVLVKLKVLEDIQLQLKEVNAQLRSKQEEKN